MHPFINHELALAREADLRRRAARDRRVYAVVSRRSRRAARFRLGRARLGWLRRSRVRVGWIRRGENLLTIARRTEMATFMDVHSGFTGVTEDQLRDAHQRDLDIEAAEGVHFERAWLDPESGKVFCLSTGPSKEAVRRVHEKAGHPADEVYELPVEV
jgi:Nickel responsive protein SCO4226-like